MKQKNIYCSLSFSLLIVMAINETCLAQIIIPKENFQLTKTAVPLKFVAYTNNDFAKNVVSKTEKDLITLPNKKQVSLGDYLKTINYIEKNLSDLGYSKDRTEKVIVVSKFKSPILNQVTIPTFLSTTLLSQSALTSRFSATSLSSNNLTFVSNITKVTIPINPDNLPNDTISRQETFNIPKFNVAGYGVKIDASYAMHGIVDPFQVLDRQKNQDSLNRIIKNTANEYSIVFNVNINTDLPQIGNFNIYKIQSEFSTKASGSIKTKAKLQVLEQLLIDEDRTSTSNTVSFVKGQVYNTEKLLGAADIYMYGLNIISPVDFSLNCQGIGANFDMTVTKSNVQGTIEPILTQSIILESSATELLGPIADIANATVLDAGVGGELRLIEGGLDFGGNIGLTTENGSLKLKNEVYKSIHVNLLKGRLYTFYTYPVYTCDNIFGLLNPSCYAERRVENDLFNTGSAISFQRVLVDDAKNSTLAW
jgi:hypothetical protein